MYRLNSLNADIQLIVDGAWENRFCMNYCCSELPNTIIQETSIQQMTVITFKNLFQMKGHSTTMKIAGCLF